MVDINKALNAKNVRPVSADGHYLKRGDIVWVLHTNDCGKTWMVFERTVQRTTRTGMVSFQDKPVYWSFCLPKDKMVGDHRIFKNRQAALREQSIRNKVVKKPRNKCNTKR